MGIKAVPKKKVVFIVMIVVTVILAGLAMVQARSSSISLDSPVSFPVDI